MRFSCALVALLSARALADPEVIEIHDAPNEPGQTRRSVEEASAVPGGLGDPVRAVASLPGVVPIGLRTPVFYVRGMPPGDLAFYLDGVRVPLLFHDGVVTSVIPNELVATIDLYASAVPARFAGIAGAAIALTTRPPATELHGALAAKLYESSALIEAPVGDGSVLAAARIGYPSLVTSLISPDTHLGYWDYQTRDTWQLDPDDRLVLLAFGSHDRARDDEVETLAADQHRADLRIEHALDHGRLAGSVTAGWSSLGAAGAAVVDRALAVRGQLALELGALDVAAGVHGSLDAYRIASTSPNDPAATSPADAMPPPLDTAASADATARWHVTSTLELVLGGRAGTERSARDATVTTWFAEPVLSARYRVTPALALTTSLAVAHQLPLLRVGNAPATVVAVPGFPRGDREPQRSYQGVQAAELVLPAGVVATASVFATRTLGVSDLPAQCYGLVTGPRDMPEMTYTCADARADALAYGGELAVHRAWGERLTGELAYTWSHTIERYRDGLTLPSPYDRRHVLVGSGGYALGAWQLGARAVIYTGTPYLAFGNGERVAPHGGLRLPAFARIDLRAARTWQLAHRRSLALVLEVLNASLSHEEDRLDCGPPYAPEGTCVVSARPLFVVPSAGLELRF